MPSCIKSFILPIAYLLYNQFTGSMTEVSTGQLMAHLGERGVQVADFLGKWIDFVPKFTEDSVRLSYLALCQVLRLTVEDVNFASLKIKKSSSEYSTNTDTVLLQTKLVQALAEFLTFQVKPSGMAGDVGGGDDYGDYGDDDDYDGEDDYGDDADLAAGDPAFAAALAGENDPFSAGFGGGFDDDFEEDEVD